MSVYMYVLVLVSGKILESVWEEVKGDVMLVIIIVSTTQIQVITNWVLYNGPSHTQDRNSPDELYMVSKLNPEA